MQFAFLLEQVVNGLVLGGYYLLIALGLSLIFSVGGIVNLAHGAFYALGAYFGITAVTYAQQAGVPPIFLLPVLIVAGLLMAAVGPLIERLLRPIYDRDESFQLLLTFALVLMFQDVFQQLPEHLRLQREQLRAELAQQGK